MDQCRCEPTHHKEKALEQFHLKQLAQNNRIEKSGILEQFSSPDRDSLSYM